MPDKHPVTCALYCKREFYEQELCTDMQDAFAFCNESNEAFDSFEIHADDAKGYAHGIRKNNGKIHWEYMN
jgi:hypothetical protein